MEKGKEACKSHWKWAHTYTKKGNIILMSTHFISPYSFFSFKHSNTHLTLFPPNGKVSQSH